MLPTISVLYKINSKLHLQKLVTYTKTSNIFLAWTFEKLQLIKLIIKILEGSATSRIRIYTYRVWINSCRIIFQFVRYFSCVKFIKMKSFIKIWKGSCWFIFVIKKSQYLPKTIIEQHTPHIITIWKKPWTSQGFITHESWLFQSAKLAHIGYSTFKLANLLQGLIKF